MQDGTAAMRPHKAELEQVNIAVDKVLKDLNDQILDKVAALNTNLALNAFAIPAPPLAEAKASFDEYTSGMFKLLKAGHAQAEKIRVKVRNKTTEVLQQFASQFASQVNQAMEIERKNWKEEARAREREAAERLKQSRAAMSSESRSASRGAESVAMQEEELAKRAAKIKELETAALAYQVQHSEDADTISILRAKARELQDSEVRVEAAERALAETKAKLSEQDSLLESYREQIKDAERTAQKLKGGVSDDEIKSLRKQLIAAQREAEAQSEARADMQDRLQDSIDALSATGAVVEGAFSKQRSRAGVQDGGLGPGDEVAELRRKVAQLEAQLVDAKASAAADAAAFVPIPSPPPARRSLGEMTADELREELTVFTERVVDAKAGAVDVGVEGVSAELAALGRQLQHLLPLSEGTGGADGSSDGRSISPKSALLGVRTASPTTDELEQQLKQSKQRLAVSETEVKSLTKQMGFVAEGRRVAEQEAKKMKDELAQLRKDKKSAEDALNKLASAARTEERSEARQEAKAARAEKAEVAELRRLADKYKQAEATALAKLQAAKDFAAKYQEEKNEVTAINKQLTKQLKDAHAEHQRELVQRNKAARAESSAMAQSEHERAISREGRAQAMELQAHKWEQALENEHERGQIALRELEQQNAALQEQAAQLQSRASDAEGGLAQIGNQLAKKNAEIEQKNGQIQRLVTACSVLEQKVRTASGIGAVGAGSGSTAASGNIASSSLITVDNLSAAAGQSMLTGSGNGAGGGKRCAMCGGHALFDRSLEAATSSGFLPSSTTSTKAMALSGLREMTRFGTTAKWAPAPEPTKPGHYEDGTRAAFKSMAISDTVSGSLSLENGGGGDLVDTGPAGQDSVEQSQEVVLEPEPEPEWLRGDDGWYYGDIDGENGETMCWMASRRLGSPVRGRATREPRLQLTDNVLPPRAQSVPAGVGLPPLGAPSAAGGGKAEVDKNAGRSVQANQSVSWVEGHTKSSHGASRTLTKSSLELEVPQSPSAPKSSGGKGSGGVRQGTAASASVSASAGSGSISLAATSASIQQAQAARLPRLAGHLHVPPAALQQAQAQAQKGQVY